MVMYFMKIGGNKNFSEKSVNPLRKFNTTMMAINKGIYIIQRSTMMFISKPNAIPAIITEPLSRKTSKG